MGIFQSIQDYILRKKEKREFEKFQQTILTNRYLSIVGRHKDQYIQSHGKTLPNGNMETVVYSELGPIRETLVSSKNSHKDFAVQYDGFFNETNEQGEEERKYGFVECSIQRDKKSNTANVSLFGAILDDAQFKVYTNEYSYSNANNLSNTTIASLDFFRTSTNLLEKANIGKTEANPDSKSTKRLISAYDSLRSDFETAYNDKIAVEILSSNGLYSIEHTPQG